MSVLLVFTNCPDADTAQRIAEQAIGQHQAACATILAPCRSIYRWQGRIECAEETALLLKTTQEGYAALEDTIRRLHPYELPEIIAVPVTSGLPAYLDRVGAECAGLSVESA